MRMSKPLRWNGYGMKIRYIHAGYGLEPELDHIAVPAESEKRLRGMADKLVGTEGLIAIYVPLTTPEIYGGAMPMRGKIVGAVKLLPMPTGRNVRDYYFEDWTDGKRRWPVGWPCEVVLYPRPEARFDLKPVVELVHGA